VVEVCRPEVGLPVNLRVLFQLELKALASSRTVLAALAVYVLAGVTAIATGRNSLEREARTFAAAAAADAEEAAALRQAHPNDDAGYIAYSLFRSTRHAPSPWAALSVGQRDVFPTVLRIRALGLESQLYDSEPDNPQLRLAGAFDLAFVVTMLAPLVLIALGYGLLCDDDERGILRMIRAQGVSVGGLVAVRVSLRTTLVLAPTLMLLLFAAGALPLPFDRRFAEWVLIAGAYLVMWGALVGLFAIVARNGVTAALALAGLWLATSVVGPALANVALELALPVPQGLALTIKQRMEVHNGWDQPRDRALRRFFERHPEWSQYPAPLEKFSWTWYYANWEAGDAAVAELAGQYRENLLARHRLTEKTALVLPPVRATLAFAHIGGSDLPAHIAYLASVRTFHEELKRFFYRRILPGAKLTSADYENLPQHRFSRGPTPTPLATGAPFLAGAMVAFVLGWWALRRRLRPV
jgi:ABC-2 type transport system permease protein